MLNGEKVAVVECISKSACKSCSSNDNCGVGVVAKGLRDKSHHLSMPFKEGMEINETIELLIENKDVVKSSLIVYLIPLLLFVNVPSELYQIKFPPLPDAKRGVAASFSQYSMMLPGLAVGTATAGLTSIFILVLELSQP